MFDPHSDRTRDQNATTVLARRAAPRNVRFTQIQGLFFYSILVPLLWIDCELRIRLNAECSPFDLTGNK